MASIENSAVGAREAHSRTGSLPVQGSDGDAVSFSNARAARCTRARCAEESREAPSRTGGPPVQESGGGVVSSDNARAARCTTVPFLYEFLDAMATAGNHFLSRSGNVAVHTRNLPHWAANSTLIFITYRLADSMPAAKLRAWQEERDEWMSRHPEPWDETESREYYSTFPVKLDEMLDAGYGSCVLARPECRQIVAENLLHFNGGRYSLHAFVVMPNHVHVLMEIEKKEDLSKIVYGWKSYTGKRINEITGGCGSVWQKEYYDRLIRDARHYKNTVEYIWKNARVAEGVNARCVSRTGISPEAAGRAAMVSDGTERSLEVCLPVQESDGDAVSFFNARAARCTSRTGGPPVQAIRI